MTEIDEAPLLTTHRRPYGATATERGAAPTAISASRADVTASNTLTLSLSWFTSQTRALAPARVSNATLAECAGRAVPDGAA